MSEGKLMRSDSDRVIAGVCGGIAAYLDIDSVLVRLLFLILAFASGMGAIIYLVLWFIMPCDEATSLGTAVLKDNLDDMGKTMNSGMNRIGRPGTMGILLILLGGFFLLTQWGWFSWLGNLFWPLLIIGIGVYLLSRRQS
ncbi:MAG: PspC domain-containing protein [Chloroflexi bacterium]|nr:PspC domain-containing protein [Chloroflexota bacterium]